MEFNINWFKENIASRFSGYKLEYRSFPNGDLGSLDEIIFDSIGMSGTINFWGQGYLGLFIYDNVKEKEEMNLLVEPDKETEKEEGFNRLFDVLNI